MPEAVLGDQFWQDEVKEVCSCFFLQKLSTKVFVSQTGNWSAVLLLDALQGTQERPDRHLLRKNTEQFSGNRIKAGLASSHCCIAHGIRSFAIDCYGPGLQTANCICANISDSELLFLSIQGWAVFQLVQNLCCNPQSVLEFHQLRTWELRGICGWTTQNHQKNITSLSTISTHWPVLKNSFFLKTLLLSCKELSWRCFPGAKQKSLEEQISSASFPPLSVSDT